MSEARKKSFIKGAFILALGGFVARFLGIFIKVPLVRILGDFGMGLYGNAYPMYSFLLAVSVIGLPVAISKMVSERVSLGNYRAAYKVFKIAFVTLTVLGALCTLIMILGAKIFIAMFNWHPDTYYSIIGLAFAPLFVAMLSTFKGFFQGMQSMGFSSTAQIIESIIRVIVGLGLCVFFVSSLGSIPMGAAGATFGATAGALVACIYLATCFLFYKKKIKAKIKKQRRFREEDTRDVFRILLQIAIPITLASLISSAMNIINTSTYGFCLESAGLNQVQATELWGQLSSRAQTLVNVPVIFASSLAASLVPSISEAFVKRDRKQIQEKAFMTIKIIFMLAFPCAVGLSVLSKPITTMIFGNSNGYTLLALLSYTLLFSMVSITLQSILQGIGKLRIPLRNLAIGCVVKLVFNIVLMSSPMFNIYGAIVGTIMADCCIANLDYLAVKEHVGMKKGLGWIIVRIAFCSAIMGLVAFFGFNFLSNYLSNSISTALVILLCIGIYFGLVFVTKVFDLEEIKGVIKG